MKREIDSIRRLEDWFLDPSPAIFQGMDLTSYTARFEGISLSGCVFLGCEMDKKLAANAAEAECYLIPPSPRSNVVPFNPFVRELYTPRQLFDTLDSGAGGKSFDQIVYESYIDPATKIEKPVDLDVLLLRRIHDWSIAEALDDVLDLKTRLRTVAIMGGHDVPRDASVFTTVARLALDLTQRKYMIVTGGGPGLMEAGNLGAYCAGFAEPAKALDMALEAIRNAPSYTHPDWLSSAYQARRKMGEPADSTRSRNVGIPTWFYGHEPPNVFATHIAKYFENSVREEGMLAIALAGVIFAEGNGGTVQEIFQDACQNYYRTYAQRKSPMILFGVDYWAPSDMIRHNPKDKRKKVYPVLEKLALEKGFSDYLLITDDPTAVVKFIEDHPPV
jgi:predicted Rossmann-fold nucleotide-binding protein